MACSTPVAFFLFNRPATTSRVFEAIRQAQPEKLLVIADGARLDRSGEAEQCAAARTVLNRIDWNCEVLKNFSDVNLGCRNRVSSGLDWVFSEVEEAIILEDDCLPAPSFFQYCQELLERYRDDERVMAISGDNFQEGRSRTPYSYYFSKYSHIWGWATWQRAWKFYDVEMKTWPEYRQNQFIQSLCEDPYEQKYWMDCFEQVYSGQIDTWDYQWVYTCWSQNGLTILPDKNLISNIGFGAGATHTEADSPLANLPVSDLWEIHHPPYLCRNYTGDAYTFDYHYGGVALRNSDRILAKLKRQLKSAIKSQISNNVAI
jgi:hypothetical protein